MKHLIVCCAVAGAFTSTAYGAEKVVLYGDDDYAPYSYVENGQLKGVYVDILKKAIELMPANYQVELQPRPWKRGLAELASGAALGLFPPYMRKERPFIQPYSTAIFHETVVLFCNEDVMKKERKNFPADFAGLSVGINLGFSLSDKLTAAATAGTITLAEAKGNDLNLKKLAAKRIDCYANDRGSIVYTAKKLRGDPGLANFKLLEATELGGEDAFIGYSLNSKVAYKADFIEKMNTALEAVKKNGAVSKITDSYFK